MSVTSFKNVKLNRYGSAQLRGHGAAVLLSCLVTVFLGCTEPVSRATSNAKREDAGEDHDVDASEKPDSATDDTGKDGGMTRTSNPAGAGGRTVAGAAAPGREAGAGAAAAGRASARDAGGDVGADGNAGAGGAPSMDSGVDAAPSGSGGAPADEPSRSTDPIDPNVSALLAETADVQSLELLSNWSLLPVLRTGRHIEQSSQDRGYQTNATGLFAQQGWGNKDWSNFLCKSANADVGAAQLQGYTYDVQVCPESYVRGVVLARFEGSGRMTRFWLAGDTLGDIGVRDEVLRIYVDDNPAVAVQVPLAQVLNGMAGEIFTIPFGAFSSTYIAWHYPIVFSKKLVLAIDHLSASYYYQVDAVVDAQPQPRVAPSKRLDQRDTAHALLVRPSPVPSGATSLRKEQLSLAASSERSVDFTGPATIEEVSLRVAKNAVSTLGDVRLTVRWDGEASPAIDVPLLDLFAASQAVASTNSLALATSVDGDNQILSLRLPMPYRTNAQWTLRNNGDAAVDFQLEWTGESKVPEGDIGHLNVQLNVAAIPPAQLEQTVADVTGRGRFVGLCADLGGKDDSGLPVQSHLDILQGDFKAMADGDIAIDSTGTEDYADSAYYFEDSPKGSPFAQNWGRVDDSSKTPPGQVSFCRWHVLGDEIDFQSSFHAVHQVSQHDLAVVQRHRTIAFLYR